MISNIKVDYLDIFVLAQRRKMRNEKIQNISPPAYHSLLTEVGSLSLERCNFC
jgi:hypothetical protein